MKIGITGHQDIHPRELLDWVKLMLTEVIDVLSIELGISCLARGADQMFAKLLIQKRIPYKVIIASKDYETTFPDNKSKKQYKRFLEAAETIEVLNFELASESAFFAAGKQMVEESDVVIAVWDGYPARGLGGTGDVARYVLENKKRLIHIDTTLKTVIYK